MLTSFYIVDILLASSSQGIGLEGSKSPLYLLRHLVDHKLNFFQNLGLVLLDETPQFVAGQSFSGVGFDEVEDDALEDGGVPLAC